MRNCLKLVKHTIYLLFGSNIGDRKMFIDSAIELLKDQPLTLQTVSEYYETEAWGNTDQDRFVNAVARWSTDMTPHEVLKVTQQVELDLGRIRMEKWGPRKIDIDLLYFDDQVISSDNLVVPHPGIPTRHFTLLPLVNIAAEFVHPVLKITNRQMLEQVDSPASYSIYPSKVIRDTN